jgi:hypothetical protein
MDSITDIDRDPEHHQIFSGDKSSNPWQSRHVNVNPGVINPKRLFHWGVRSFKYHIVTIFWE